MAAAAEEDEAQGAPEWITTFVDMISLLVTFFILLFTFSTIQEYDTFTFRENIVGTRGIFEDESGNSANDPPEEDMMSAMDVARGADVPHSRPLDKLSENLEEMGQKLTSEHIELDPTDVKDGLVIRFGESTSFAPGSTEVNPALRRALIELARVMEHYPHLLAIEGFTDSKFNPGVRYATPEALGTGRAAAAARIMIENSELSPNRIQLAGLGMQRPLNANASASERTLNRRVEVRIVALDQARARSLEGSSK